MWVRKRQENVPATVPSLKVVGWGPFPLPGERKRQKRARSEAEHTMALLAEVESRSSKG